MVEKSGNKGILGVGIILLIVGLGLVFSSLDLSNLQPMNISYESPIGTFTTDSFTEDEEQRIFVGIIFTGISIALIKIGK